MGEASEPFNKSWTVVVYVRTGEGLMSRAFSINPSLFDSQGTRPIFRILTILQKLNPFGSKKSLIGDASHLVRSTNCGQEL
jgi:hypothetical protein